MEPRLYVAPFTSSCDVLQYKLRAHVSYWHSGLIPVGKIE